MHHTPDVIHSIGGNGAVEFRLFPVAPPSLVVIRPPHLPLSNVLRHALSPQNLVSEIVVKALLGRKNNVRYCKQTMLSTTKIYPNNTRDVYLYIYPNNTRDVYLYIYPNNTRDVYLYIYHNNIRDFYLYIYPNNTRDVYLYIYSVSAFMG